MRRLLSLLAGQASGLINASRLASDLAVTAPTGLASYLSTGAVAVPPVGALIENFVLGELLRQLTWARTSARLYHYRDRDRDRDRDDVDELLEDNAGQVVGIEVKATETVRSDDFRSLRILQSRLGPRFRAGFVLYCGTDSHSFGDKLACLPISALWTTPASSHTTVE
jgi:predicted AAA+ superfamily ATPase